MAAPRFLEKFESDGASISYTFPLGRYEWQSTQPFRSAYRSVVGASYAHDFYGALPYPKDVGIETVRAILEASSTANLDTAVDNLKEELVNIGRGKLYTLTDASVRRWAWAKLLDMPEFRVGVGMGISPHQPVIIRFARFGDWRHATATEDTQTCDEDPEAFTITNPGNAPVYDAVFTIEANTAGGFSNLVITNSTTGYSITTTRDSAADTDEIVIDCGKGTFEYNGADDYATVTLGATQVGFMRLDPGSNSFSIACDGTPNFDFSWSFSGAYH